MRHMWQPPTPAIVPVRTLHVAKASAREVDVVYQPAEQLARLRAGDVDARHSPQTIGVTCTCQSRTPSAASSRSIRGLRPRPELVVDMK